MLTSSGNILKHFQDVPKIPSPISRAISAKTYNRRLRPPRPKAQNEKTISLLEQLFPQGSAQLKIAQRKERLVPRQEIGKLGDKGDSKTATFELGSWNAELNLALPYPPTTAVALLSRASKLLGEEDFRAVGPKGRHIEGWTHNGEVLKVIKMRDPIDMVPTGSYFVIFKSEESAKAYIAHVGQLHHEAGAYKQPSGLEYYTPLPLPPPPPSGWVAREAHDSNPFDTYALIPPSQTFNLALIKRPFKPLIQHLLENGGYPLLMKNKRSKHEVLLFADRAKLTDWQVRAAVAADGADRGVKWATVPSNSIREIMLYTKAERKVVTTGSVERQEEDVGIGRTKNYMKKFIISFEDPDEAKRFVMHWHRRDISSLVAEPANSEVPTIVNAELIW